MVVSQVHEQSHKPVLQPPNCPGGRYHGAVQARYGTPAACAHTTPLPVLYKTRGRCVQGGYTVLSLLFILFIYTTQSAVTYAIVNVLCVLVRICSDMRRHMAEVPQSHVCLSMLHMSALKISAQVGNPCVCVCVCVCVSLVLRSLCSTLTVAAAPRPSRSSVYGNTSVVGCFMTV